MSESATGRLIVGHIRRPHGLRGHVFVQLVTDRVSRVEPGSVLWAGDEPLEVVEHRTGSGGRHIVRFAEIADRTTAERYTNRALSADPIDDPDALWVHDLVGRSVVDQHGTDRGRCVAVVANPASDLLELHGGALVPTVFVTGIVDGEIRVETPEGLFDDDLRPGRA